MSYTVFLVEDEDNLNQVLTSYLKKEEWDVTSFTNGEDALANIERYPDLWILDIMLPDTDGFQVIKAIKEKTPHIPVIFISARDADIDRIVGLEMGSDDYISKPFMPRELIIRAKKILERVYEKEPIVSTIKIGPYHLFVKERMIKENNEAFDITSKEFDLIYALVQHKGKAFSRDELLNHVWGHDYFGSDRVVDDLVRRIRKKMPHLPIETIYGHGYRLTF